jgi:hypothetical protein
VPQVPVGPAPFPPAYPDGEVVTSEQLEQWDSGSLADYLERRRLLGPEAPSGPSRMRPAPPPSWGAGYPAAPPSGFWLSDSPYALGGGGYAY